VVMDDESRTEDPKKPIVQVKLDTGRGHPAVLVGSEQSRPARRARMPTSEARATELRRRADELALKRLELEEEIARRQRDLDAEWPEDLTRPHIPTVSAIDWKEQPSIPAEKIDWSHQGEPLRVRPTLGAIIATVGLAISIFSAGAYFYWGVKTHISNKQVHVPADGIPWGVRTTFETRKEAKIARTKLIHTIAEQRRAEHDQLKEYLVKALKPKRRRRRKRQ